MKTRSTALLVAILLLTGCAAQPAPEAPEEKALTRYTASFLTLFDTFTTMIGYDESEEAFRATAERFRAELETYHQLFDIYNEYPGMNNLKTVNDHAGQSPVAVDRRIIDLLLFCREMHDTTGGVVDVTMGSVLRLWHNARTDGLMDVENAALPDADALKEAALHRGFDNLVIDEEAGTVFITDPAMSLDVGAIAKGYAVEQVCRSMPEGLLVSVGGNICATGPNPSTGQPWSVGIQDPNSALSENLHIVSVSKGAVVTSGDYQRYYVVDGVAYHHLIDPETLFPGTLWKAVSVVCSDSAVADALSTALFLLPQEEGQRLLDTFDAYAVWCTHDGSTIFSPGYAALIKQD